MHHEGIDFEEMFASIVRFDSIRIVLTITAHHEWNVS